jgi:WD40 repeat protein
LLATVGEDGIVRLWDLATGTELRQVGGRADRLYNVAFSPDGRMLAATGSDSDIRLWELADLLGAEGRRQEPHPVRGATERGRPPIRMPAASAHDRWPTAAVGGGVRSNSDKMTDRAARPSRL